VCPTHVIDNFLKNVGTSEESIKMQANLMGDAAASEIEWNESFFCDCFDKVAKMITFVSRKQKPFVRFQILIHELMKKGKKLRFGTVILKSVETRFVSRHGMTERVMLHKKVYKALTKDELFLV
jgi:hypothetical protein